MTTVEVFREKDGSCKGFCCMGHAGFSRKHFFHKEPDILCASISVLVINTINCIEELGGEKLHLVTNEETGFIRCEFQDKLTEKSGFLIEAMVYGLQKLSREYGEQYLQVKIKEV